MTCLAGVAALAGAATLAAPVRAAEIGPGIPPWCGPVIEWVCTAPWDPSGVTFYGTECQKNGFERLTGRTCYLSLPE